MIRQLLLTALMGFTASLSFAQNDKKVSYPIQEVSKLLIESIGSPQIRAQNAKYYQIDVTTLIPQMNGVMHREYPNSGFIANVNLPHPDGTFHAYRTIANSTLHPELNEKFPSIYTYDASGVENGARVKWDITEHGLHAMIMIPGESTIFIDPVLKGNDDYYIVYRKSDFQTDKVFDCSFNSDINTLKSNNQIGSVKAFGTCELRTYRLALSATGEYTAFHGGTVAQAQAAQATSMNRVNGVFEKDMAITMVIIPNNDQIIYTNGATDPFSNGNPGNMINENQTVCDGVIGNGNYDIGHVFGTNSGGLAGLGVVCNNSNKARGVTGSGSPIGDTFDIDYVAHEMGHQFGANHTQNNNCNRNNATAMEPGSASTIMGYAGICAPNVQSNSDDHFHGVSLEEIGFEILSAGHTCEQITALANSAPIVLGTNGNVTVPANTPFALTATVTDVDGDPVTYNWEQMDPEVSTQSPVPTSTVGPNFRSFSSSTSPTRYFPNLNDLSNGGPFTWEVIPSVSRTMNFRVTVRDNSPGAGGCNDHADVTVTTDDGSGPFVVLYPSATGILWTGATTETVTWDVANTDQAPVACANVDILLSIDGGQTYPITLASNVPNDGSETITAPNLATTTARIMVICSSGTFFDISDNDFEIIESTFDYTLTTSPTNIVVCQPSDANFTLNIGSIGGYNDPVTLSVSGVPAGATSSFSVNPVTPIGSSVLNITNTGAAAPGDYTLTITANSTSGTKTNDVILSISSGAPAPVTLLTPADLATAVAVPTSFTWTTSAGSGMSYEIEIATDAGFTAIVDQATGLATTNYSSTVLSPNTIYYWRVRAVSGCGASAWSSSFSFTTDGCFTVSSTDVPVTISAAGTPTITSTITIPTNGTINDVNVIGLNGDHTWINDLIVTLTSPTGTSVTLWSQICNNEDNFDINFDDAAASAVLPCPPTGGGTYQPNGSLASINGEDPSGVWTLTIQDMADQDGGSLNGWSLQICLDATPCNQPDLATLSGTTTICEGNSTTLSVTGGNLNDATNWAWYEGSCGGTAVGTGTSITVSPTASTSYFVRGEGGCVVGGACQQIDVQVNPVYNTSENASICQGDTYTYPDGTTGTVTEAHTSLLTSISGCDSIVVTNLTINDPASLITLSSPTNGATGVALPTTFDWTTAPEAGVTYTIEISTDSGFATIVESASGLIGNTYDANTLAAGTIYYWHVSAENSCGGAGFSSAFSFTTNSCSIYSSTDVPVNIPNGTGTYTSTINVPTGGSINDVNIVNLTGTHGASGNLIFSLQSPTGTIVELMNQACGNDNDFDIAFDDEAASATLPCPVTDGNSYQPSGLLSDFDGENQQGIWTLIIQDIVNPNSGSLTSWSIEICTDPASPCIEPDVPTVSPASSICTGQTTTLSVTGGSLNDATDWTWYEGTCGGTLVGTGVSIVVTPGTSNSYFVRGEGGCTTPGVCAQVDVQVNPIYNETDAQSICQGDSYIFGTQTLTIAGTYTELFSSTGGCDSTVILTLSVNPTYNETDAATICQGETYPFGTQTLTTAGTYTEVFSSVDGCDSTVILTLTVNPTYNETDAQTICQGDSYTFGTQSLTTAGTYTEIFSSVDGCDSIVVLTLNVNPSYNETDAQTICQGNTYSFGTQTLTLAGTYTEVFSSVDGCDSTVVLTLDVVTAFNETDAVTICQGDSYTFGIQTLTLAGTYTELFGSQNGCDSTVVLTLDVVTAFNETDTATICQGDTYTFGTQTLTTAGNYTELFTSQSGCDSNVVLTLTVLPAFNETDAAIICQGETYPFGTQALTTAGTYTEVFSSADGCDSTVVLTLSVNPTYNETDAATICQGDSYSFGTQTLTTAGTYTEVFSSVNGCDSIIVLTLNVNPTYNETDVATICLGDSFMFGTQTLTASGTYTELFSSISGCDSVVVLTLNVTTSITTNQFAEICQGDTYTFGASNLTSGGTYTQIFTSVAGCDSIVNLTLNVLPSITVTESAEICEGQIYTFPDGTTGTTTEAHISVLTGANGCDSTVITALTVHPSYSLNESVTICSGETYIFPDGTTGTTDMMHTSVFSSVNGCDSIIVTDLAVQLIDNSVSVVNNKTITASQTGATYQWIDCNTGNPIAGAINQSFTPTNTIGNYAVIITIGNCSDTSECTLIDLTGLDEFEQSILIYPNPVSNELNIEWSGDVKCIDVTDAKGKLIEQLVPNSSTAKLLMTKYANGVYFIHIYTDTGRYVYDLLKQ